MPELQPPPIAADSSAVEVLRVWGGPGLPQQYVVEVNWEDPGAWGLLLVDLARHVSKAYAASGVATEGEALDRIKLLFDAEWASPTDNPEQL